jgi:putative redox protein
MMKVTLKLEEGMKISGSDSRGHITNFDTVEQFGGNDSAPTPMEVMLQAMTACSVMDVAAILNKKKKTIDSLDIEIEGTKAPKHPMVFTNVEITYILKSPDTEIKDLERAIELSQTTYCGASAMFQRSGCEVKTKAVLNPNE